MPSKTVNDRRKLNRALRAAILVHEADVVKGLQERLEPFLDEGEDLSGLTVLHGALTRFLAAREVDLIAADEGAYVDRLDNRLPIRERDEGVRELRAKLIEIRKTVGGAVGDPEGDELLALEGTLTQDPLRLHRQGRLSLARLRDPSLPMPPLRLEGVVVDRDALAGALESRIERLGAALAAVERDRKIVVESQEAKNKARDLHDSDTRAVAGFLTYLFRLGGKNLAADRVRPASRRRPSREDVDALARNTKQSAVDGPERENGDRSAGTDPPAVNDNRRTDSNARVA